MKVEYILLGLQNLSYVRTLQSFAFKYLDFINREKCTDMGYNWYCETFPHVTLISNLQDQTSNSCYRQLKYKNPTLWKAFVDKVKREGLTFPELIIDTFNNDDAIILKINCQNCNIYPELCKLHELLGELPNAEKYPNYQPHITITYLKKDLPLGTLPELIKELKSSLPISFLVKDISLSSEEKEIDTIQFA